MQTVFDWDGFKKKEFAVLCEANKEQFFDDCERNGIHCFLSEFAKISLFSDFLAEKISVFSDFLAKKISQTVASSAEHT